MTIPKPRADQLPVDPGLAKSKAKALVMAGFVALSALVASSCGDGGRAGEIACQRRLVELSGDIRPGPRGTGLARAFSRASARFDRMSLEGCSEGQRATAAAFARVTRELASSAARIGDDPLRALERQADLGASRDFLEFQSLLEGFDRRRQVLREELEKMAGDGR